MTTARPFRAFAAAASAALLTAAAACTPLNQAKPPLSPVEAEAIAILAVRTAERNHKLELDATDTRRTDAGHYVVLVRQRTKSAAVAVPQWDVVVRPNRSAEVLPSDPAPPAPDPVRLIPDPLRNFDPTLPPPRLLPYD